MSENINSDTLKQMQDEVLALITAWADRGISADESAMILAGTVHSTLAQLGYSLGQIVALLADGWRKTNGKL